MKKLAIAGAVALALSCQTQAETILGVYAGSYLWLPNLSGNADISNTGIDLDSDDNSASVYVALEHPIPLIPNLRLQATDLSSSSSAEKLDLSHTDATLYYEILDNWVHLDIGMTARIFDGTVKNKRSGQSVDVDDTVALAYGSAMLELPIFDLYAAVSGNTTNIGDNEIYDFTARVGWEAILGLGVEVGYRSFKANMDNVGNGDIDSTFKGPFAGVTYQF